MACSAIVMLIACNSGETKEVKTDTTSTGTAPTEVKKDEAWVPVDSATQMKAMMAYGTPGEMQKMMASWNGTWSSDMTMWEYDGATPHKMASTAVNSMVLGGRYQSSKHTGTMMGMPFEGMSLMGYDNAMKKFVSSWVDNWGTGIMMLSGPWDATTKTLTLTGSMPDIVRPGKECTMREVFTVVDDNTQHMEMYGPDPKTGKEFKMMEITMKKKK